MSNGWRTHSDRKPYIEIWILLTRSRSLLQVYLGGHHRQYLWSEQSQSFHHVAEEKTQWYIVAEK